MFSCSTIRVVFIYIQYVMSDGRIVSLLVLLINLHVIKTPAKNVLHTCVTKVEGHSVNINISDFVLYLIGREFTFFKCTLVFKKYTFISTLVFKASDTFYQYKQITYCIATGLIKNRSGHCWLSV